MVVRDIRRRVSAPLSNNVTVYRVHPVRPSLQVDRETDYMVLAPKPIVGPMVVVLPEYPVQCGGIIKINFEAIRVQLPLSLFTDCHLPPREILPVPEPRPPSDLISH